MNLTVVIPVYNGSKSIVRCLDSLAGQTYQDFRALLIDDGSTDGSSDVIRAWTEAHPSVEARLVSRPNSGAAETRNYGIAQAEAEYIAFIDQDDYVTPDYLQTYVDTAQSTGADIVCGGYQRYDADNHRALRTVSLAPDPWAKFVVTAPWAHLYRTDFLKSNGIRFLKTPIGEDVYFSLMAYAHTDRVVIIPHTGYYWVDNPVSVSNDRQKRVSKQVDPFILLDALDADMPKDGKIDRRYLEYYLYRYVVWYLLFTVRGSSRSQVFSQYHRLMKWLKARYPMFEKNELISLFGPKGEPFSIRLSVWGFTLLYKTHLIVPFLKLLSRRDDPESLEGGGQR